MCVAPDSTFKPDPGDKNALRSEHATLWHTDANLAFAASSPFPMRISGLPRGLQGAAELALSSADVISLAHGNQRFFTTAYFQTKARMLTFNTTGVSFFNDSTRVF